MNFPNPERFLFCLGVAVLVAKAALAAGDERQVLPPSVVPSHYDLTISPDAAALVFKGSVRIKVNVTEPTTEVVLNAKGLTFDHAALDGVGSQSVTLDSKLERAKLVFPKVVDAGVHELEIDYHGPILKGTYGFFAMEYDSPAGKRVTLATNLEPTGARMFLPCWDEPALKATFTVSVDKPKDRVAISTMPIAKTTSQAENLERVVFAETPKMSTYLLFLSIGDYERVNRIADKTDVGIVVKRGDLPRARYALDQACQLLHYYNDYFGFPYPLPKLDLIAAPGEITGGSMENWGAIFYSQHHLLFDPKTSTERDRQYLFLVVSHEMAHQWFGDLVTMQWWDNLWLNEGFARWMQTHAADALHPDWRTGLQAYAIFERGKRADAKPSTHPILQPVSSAEQAQQAFDAITYNKGAAVITMLEWYIGADNFREGVRHYMRAHPYGNTSDTDLWSEMQKVADKPIVQIENDFTRQPGLPLIQVKQADEGSELTVARFYENPSAESASKQSWHIPIAISSTEDSDLTMLLEGQAKISAPAPLVNATALSYTRVFYSPKQTEALVARFPKLAPAAQLNLMNDAWALGEAGYASAADLLDYIRALPAESDAIVWTRACELVVTIERNYSASPEQNACRHFALAILKPVATRVGTSVQPKEDPAVTSLRMDVWRAQARFGDAAALTRAQEVFAAENGSQEERRAALQIVGRAADKATFDKLLAKARATPDPLDRMRILEALAEVADPTLAARFTEIALSSDAPSGTAPSLLDAAAENNPESVWKMLAPHFDDPNLPIDQSIRGLVISGIAGRSALPIRIDDLRRYADGHIAADARQAVDAAVASIGLNQRVRERAIPQINAWITKQTAK